MARQRFDDLQAHGASISRYLKFQADARTLSGNVTLLDDDGVIWAADAGGSSRNVTLPARASTNDGQVRIIINLSTAGENLVIKNSSATTLLTLPSGGVALVLATGTDEAPGTREWKAVPIGGEDLALADDLNVTGDAAITGNLSVGGSVSLGNTLADVLSFYGATGSSQIAAASQAAPTSTAPVSISATQWGFSTSTQAQAILSLVTQLRSDLVTLGLIKGAA